MHQARRILYVDQYSLTRYRRNDDDDDPTPLICVPYTRDRAYISLLIRHHRVGKVLQLMK